jgi:hypothetical protein
MQAARRRRSARNSVVDLTQSQSPIPSTATASASRAPRAPKRCADPTSAEVPGKRRCGSLVKIEDEVNEAPGADDELAAAQQMGALKQQNGDGRDDGPVKVGKRTCIICLENFTNATTSICGTSSLPTHNSNPRCFGRTC